MFSYKKKLLSKDEIWVSEKDSYCKTQSAHFLI